MKKIFLSLILLFCFNSYAIPQEYNDDVRQFIYTALKDPNYKQKVLDKMRSFSHYFSIRGEKYAADKINLTIYYIEVFDIENLPEEQQKVILFFIKNV